MTPGGDGAAFLAAAGKAALLPLVLLAACARDPAPAEAGAMLARVLEEHRASLVASSGGAAAAFPGTPGGDAGPEGAGPSRAIPRAAAVPGAAPRDAAALLGQAPAALLRALGPPALRRREGDAEIWLYDAGTCQLDLVLYPAGNGVQVGWAAARAAGTGRITEAACLGAVARGARPAGQAGV